MGWLGWLGGCRVGLGAGPGKAASVVATVEGGAFEQQVDGAGATVFRQAGGEAEYLGMLAQPGVDVTLDQRALAIGTGGLAVGDAHAADLAAGGFGKEFPEGFAGLLDAHAVQVEAALEGDLAGLEAAHLAFLDAVGRPEQLVLGADVDHEL